MDNDILQRFTSHLKNALARSIELATQYKQSHVTPGILLFGLSEQKGSIGAEVLQNCNISGERVREKILDTGKEEKKARISMLPSFAEQTRHILERAAVIAFEHKHHYIGTEHALLAIIEDNGEDIQALLQNSESSAETIKQQLTNVLSSTSRYSTIQSLYTTEHATQQAQSDEITVEDVSETPALDFFGKDLTAKENIESLDPVIGRSDEIERLVHILSRRTKNNPVLIGEPGVGKTAIAEGLAKRIAEGDVPDVLLHKRLVGLDLSLLIAGTMYRGEFESRIRQLLEEVRANPDIILFIDELHTIVGAGTVQGGTMDAANMLKPALAKGDIRCIGATTSAEYRKHIEADPALDRRFQAIQVDEPTEKDAIAILSGLAQYYEKFHHITLPQETLEAAVTLSVRYISDQQLPDKAIDLIDEAGAKARVNSKMPAPLKKLELAHRELSVLRKKKETAIRTEKFEDAIALKEAEVSLEAKIATLYKKIQKLAIPTTTVTPKDIAIVVSSVSGIPVEHIISSPTVRLEDVHKNLSERIIGQDEALDTVLATLKRSATGLTPSDRPLGSFLFLGPSGVGKTELAKSLADIYFDDPNALIRMDMSEFSEGFTVSKMIGAPAGYVGYNESIKLADSIRKKPYSVVLFDEIEKAHPDVFHILLQILEDGHLTDSSGRELNFRHSIIILTSNVGLDMLTTQAELGFDLSQGKSSDVPFEDVQKAVFEEMQQSFPQEFLNRIDQHVVFRPLSKKALKRIVDLNFQDVQTRLKAKNIRARLLPSARAELISESYQPEQGARRIRKVIADRVELALADKLLKKSIRPGDRITIAFSRDRFLVKKEKKA